MSGEMDDEIVCRSANIFSQALFIEDLDFGKDIQ